MNTGSATSPGPAGLGTESLSSAALAEAWQTARQETADAYAAWTYAAPEQRRGAYAVYLAAADREAAAEHGFHAGTRA